MSNMGSNPSNYSDNGNSNNGNSIQNEDVQPLYLLNVNGTNNGSSDNESASVGSSTITASRSSTPTRLPNKGGRNNSKGSTGKKRKKQNMPKTKTEKGNFEFVCTAKEDHGLPIFGCQFNHRLKPGEPLILATVGSNRISIYECLSDGHLKILQVYADPDTDENFYCCAWTDDKDSKPLLAAAGARGVIRIISPTVAQSVKHCLGHGHAINDLVFHPKDQNLLLSASKDHSLRLWNIKTDFCVAIFGGVEGHRDEVLAADIDVTGSRIVSSGMDHSLKVWDIKQPGIENAIAVSYTFDAKSSRPFPTVKQNFPDFSTRDVHRNYVDCTKWCGDFILSKSCENTIVCWKAGTTFERWEDLDMNTKGTTFVYRLDIEECDIWFIRFSMDFWKRTLALGNQSGKTYIYDLTGDVSKIKSTILTHPKCNRAVRQTALSRDGKVLICVCDDATIWRWDICQDESDNE